MKKFLNDVPYEFELLFLSVVRPTLTFLLIVFIRDSELHKLYMQLHPLTSIISDALNLGFWGFHVLTFSVPLLLMHIIKRYFEETLPGEREPEKIPYHAYWALPLVLSVSCLGVCIFQLFGYAQEHGLFSNTINNIVTDINVLKNTSSLREFLACDELISLLLVGSICLGVPLIIIFRRVRSLMTENYDILFENSNWFITLLYLVPITYSLCTIFVCYPLLFIPMMALIRVGIIPIIVEFFKNLDFFIIFRF